MDKMDKPLTMIIKDTKTKLADVCNKSGLPLGVLDFIIKDIHLEIRSLEEREEIAYMKALENENIEINEDKD